jgi:hypothetical protein
LANAAPGDEHPRSYLTVELRQPGLLAAPLPKFAANTEYEDRCGESDYKPRAEAMPNELRNQDHGHAEQNLDDGDEVVPKT